MKKTKKLKTKGKDKPPWILNDASTKKLAKKERKKTLHNAYNKLSNMAKVDKEYLMGMFEVFRAGVEPNINNKVKTTGKKYRYTPKQMWNNIVRYFEITIQYGQPLTISGIGAFNGITRKDLFLMMNKDNFPPEYEFLKDCAKFVEMYNEYAAHKKMNPAGPIFILKNFGWTDRYEVAAAATEGALTESEREAAQKRVAEFSEGKVIKK